MKALIRVTRQTEYATIVEIPQDKFDRLLSALEDGDYAEQKAAEKVLNGMIDTRDWQDDTLIGVCGFEPFIEVGK